MTTHDMPMNQDEYSIPVSESDDKEISPDRPMKWPFTRIQLQCYRCDSYAFLRQTDGQPDNEYICASCGMKMTMMPPGQVKKNP